MYREIDIPEEKLSVSARQQLDAMNALDQIREICRHAGACYRCPFNRYEHDLIIRDHIYEVKELCAVYDLFRNIPREMDLSKLYYLFDEGRIGTDEILHEKSSEGSGELRHPDAPSAETADRSDGNAEDPRTDH